MADTIKIFGSNLPKPVVFGGAGLVLVGGVYYYRKNKASQAANSAIQQAGTNETDPATGYPYGSPEDAAALQTQNAYVSPSGGGYGFTGYAGGSGSSVFGSGTPGSFNSNAEWAQYVEAYEISNMGADAPTVGNAIGKYLTGQPIDPSMVGIVQSAIAIAGYPPVSGPNGDPPNYITSNSTPTPMPTPTPTPTPSPTPTSLITIPQTKGNTAGTAHNKLVAAGFIPIADPNQKATWIVAMTKPQGGTKAQKGSVVQIITTNEV